jgi:hypothetical protein
MSRREWKIIATFAIVSVLSAALVLFGPSATLYGKEKNLAGTNEIRIPNPVSVRPVQNRVSCAVAISDAADSPQAVAAGYDLHPGCGCDLRWL